MDTDPGRLQRLLGLFETAAELPAAERSRFLADACGGDAALRADVEAMLRADETSEALPTSPTGWLDTPLPPPEDEDLATLRFGPWQAVGVLGRGGMGAVYRVERADGAFRQVAALKRIRIGLDTREAQQRFLRERQILATLRHPNIARLLDGGLAGDTPYFAMELVEGERIDRWCDARQLGLRERVKLFLQVLAAVAEAHRNLVVHRDLKASNVLVDAEGHVRLLDFGIAQLKEEDSEQTQTQHRAFTPDFASPEQLRAEPVTTASDIYQLGLLLYDLLLGRHPFGVAPQTPWHRKLAMLEEPPVAPSRPVTAEVAGRRGGTPAAVARQVSGDLEAILLRAIAREPVDRYPSADAMSKDLRAWLDGAAVSARMPSSWESFTRSVRRNRIAYGAGAAIAAALFVGLGVAMVEARRANRNELAVRQALASAELNAKRSSAIKETFERMLMHSMMHDGGRQTTVREMIDQAAHSVDTRSGRGDSARVSLLLDMVKIYLISEQKDSARELLEKVRPRAVALIDAQPLFAFRLAALDADFLPQTDAKAPGSYRNALRLAQPYLATADESEFEDVRMTMANLRSTLEVQGLYHEQEVVARDILAHTLARYGERNPRTLQTQLNLVRSLLLTQHYREAAALARTATEYARTHFGPDSQMATSGRASLAYANANIDGGWQEAKREFGELIQVFRNPRVDMSGTRGVRARLHVTRLLLQERQDARAKASLADLAASLAQVRGEPEPALAMHAGWMRAEQAWNEGRVLESRREAAAVTALPWSPLEAESAMAQIYARLQIARADADGGHCVEASRQVADSFRLLNNYPQAGHGAIFWPRGAEVLLRCGDPDAALRIAKLAEKSIASQPDPQGYFLGLAQLAEARAMRVLHDPLAGQMFEHVDRSLAAALPPQHPLRNAIAQESKLQQQ